MSRKIDVPGGRLAGLELRRGRLWLTLLEGSWAGRMYVVKAAVDPDDELLLTDLAAAADRLYRHCHDRLADLRGQGDEELDLRPTEGI